jgi:hypothetical protein
MIIGRYKTVAGLLADKKRWIKGDSARSTRWSGTECPVWDPKAACFCLSGALARVYGRPLFTGAWTATTKTRRFVAARKRLEKVIQKLTGSSSIVNFNDARKTTHADVLAVARKAKI